MRGSEVQLYPLLACRCAWLRYFFCVLGGRTLECTYLLEEGWPRPKGMVGAFRVDYFFTSGYYQYIPLDCISGCVDMTSTPSNEKNGFESQSCPRIVAKPQVLQQESGVYYLPPS